MTHVDMLVNLSFDLDHMLVSSKKYLIRFFFKVLIAISFFDYYLILICILYVSTCMC